MDWNQPPIIDILKNTLPTIYLDTNIMILLSQYEKGMCKNEYIKEIAEFYNLLTKLIAEKRIICSLGDQLSEMGMTSQRKHAKDFLLNFTNEWFVSPDEIELAWMKKGYTAFIEDQKTINFAYTEIVQDSSKLSFIPFKIHMSPVYTQEKAEMLRQRKNGTTALINNAKKSGDKRVSFDIQLSAELEAEYQVLLSSIANRNFSQEYFNVFMNVIETICRVTGRLPNEVDISQYINFLQSMYHHKTPFVRIRSYLWALRMQRQNNIKHSDFLDTSWVSAYLPFVDYAVTDNDCCKLIKDAKLDSLFSTKVFSLNTIQDLLNTLKGDFL